MNKTLITFILSVVLVLVLGYGVVAPLSNKDNNTIPSITDGDLEMYEKIENNWANEYNIRGSIKDINIK
jgi:hypothetical protein